MRIALLPSSYLPALGGVEELTRHLALALRDAGDEVEVWTLLPDDSDPESVEILDGIVVRRLPMPLPATNWPAIRRSTVTGPRTLMALRSAVAGFHPDVLHVQCFGPNGVYAAALSRLTGLPLVVTLQGETVMDDTDIFEESRSLRTSLRSALRRADAVTACSAFTLADAESRFGLAPGKGQVVFNGVAADAGGPATDPSAGSPVDAEDRPYIFALGRIVEKKGFDLLLEAYAAVPDPARRADLVIAGSGAVLDRLERRVDELGIRGQVRFVGRLDREAVARAMAGAALFVIPSRLEPFGIVILEAWRAGVAVVATNRGGPPEFVRDGVDGRLVDPFDTAGFAAALEGLLSDPDGRQAMGSAGAARVDEFLWPRIAAQYRSIYTSVMSRSVEARSLGSGSARSAAPVGEGSVR
jgi:glycogen synthase